MKVSHMIYYDQELECRAIKSQLVLEVNTPIESDRTYKSAEDKEKFIKEEHIDIFRYTLYGGIKNKIMHALSAIRAGYKEETNKRLTEALDIIRESVK